MHEAQKHVKGADYLCSVKQKEEEKKLRTIAAYVCPPGYELWKSYLSFLLCGSTGPLRISALTAHTSLLFKIH